jgi:uncharacterized protein (TIGR02145 family)
MKKILLLTAMIVAGMMTTSCSSDDDSMEQHTALRPGDVPIVLSSNVQPESRTASPLPVNTSVTVWADDANSDAYFGAWQLTANASGKLVSVSVNEQKYYPMDKSYIDIYATSGISTTSNEAFPTTAKSKIVAADQSAANAYKASDVLYGVVNHVNSASTDVDISMYHMMTKVSVSLVAGSEITQEELATAQVSLVNVQREALFTPAKATAIEMQTPSTRGAMMQAGTDDDNKGEIAMSTTACIPPQTVSAGRFIKVSATTSEGLQDFYVTLDNSMTLSSGYSYNFEVTVNNSSSVGYSVSVVPWADETNSNLDMAVVTTAQIGDFVFSDGTWGSLAANPGKTPVAIIFSNTTSVIDFNDGYTHGYAMALKNVHSSGSTVGTYKWANSNSDVSGIINTSYSTWQTSSSDMEGRTNTSFINTSSYPAGYAAMTTFASQVAAPSGTSGWFLPSTGQWYNILVNLGGMAAEPDGSYYWSGNTSSNFTSKICATALNNKISVVGAGNYDAFFSNTSSNEYYWSSSEYSSSSAYFANFNSSGSMLFAGNGDKSGTRRVRAVLAF